jgi:hypothetical protein
MPATNRTARTIFRYAASALALIGWGGTIALGIAHGEDAGINTWWLSCISVAIVFSMIAGQAWMLPDRSAREEQAAVYAVGFQEGLGCGACPLRPEPGGTDERTRHLGLVRS